tara:strand:+ start:2366 stop:3406 length:1041 start_codon:yes stop_codon:yes gene_type:complete
MTTPSKPPDKIFTLDELIDFQRDLVETMEERYKNNLPVNKAFGGPFGTDVPAPRMNYIRARNEKVIRKKNAYITFGTDRPDGVASGYGGKGAQRANRIDIVVGRMASKPQDPGTEINNSFSADAARIYLSQATKIDANFGLADGIVPPESLEGHSGIGIKADAVRIIGREGIKIVTGKGIGFGGYGMKGETNSRGGKIFRSAPPIELIAGNYSDRKEVAIFNMDGSTRPEMINYLQPIAMGELTRDSLLELSDILDDLWSALYGFLMEQMTFNGIVGAACAGAATSPASNAALAPVGAYTAKNIIVLATKGLNPMWNQRAKKVMWEVNYLKPFGYKYICSRNVFST